MNTMVRSATNKCGPRAGASTANQGERREHRQAGREHVEPCRDDVSRQQREHGRREDWDDENRGYRIEHQAVPPAPRWRSSACTSTVSKRSRMRKRKMPITMNAMRIEKATLISTTSGMPVAPAAGG